MTELYVWLEAFYGLHMYAYITIKLHCHKFDCDQKEGNSPRNYLNIPLLSVTFETFHFEMSPLNAIAS